MYQVPRIQRRNPKEWGSPVLLLWTHKERRDISLCLENKTRKKTRGTHKGKTMIQTGTTKCQHCGSYKEEIFKGKWGKIIACGSCGKAKLKDIKDLNLPIKKK